jgi:hypothetical protein
MTLIKLMIYHRDGGYETEVVRGDETTLTETAFAAFRLPLSKFSPEESRS